MKDFQHFGALVLFLGFIFLLAFGLNNPQTVPKVNKQNNFYSHQNPNPIGMRCVICGVQFGHSGNCSTVKLSKPQTEPEKPTTILQSQQQPETQIQVSNCFQSSLPSISQSQQDGNQANDDNFFVSDSGNSSSLSYFSTEQANELQSVLTDVSAHTGRTIEEIMGIVPNVSERISAAIRMKINKTNCGHNYSKILNSDQHKQNFPSLSRQKQLICLLGDYLFHSKTKSKKSQSLDLSTVLTELDLENENLFRTTSLLLIHLEQRETAIQILRKLVKLRPFDPTCLFSLAFTLSLGRTKKELNEAASLLWKIVEKKDWHIRFDQIELVSISELCRVFNKLKEFGFHCELSMPTYISSSITTQTFDLDLRVVVVWDCDLCDLSLEIVEPNGNRLNSFTRRSETGGLISRDFTSGFGPVEAMYVKTTKGKYQVLVSMKNAPKTESVGVLTHLYFNFGRPQEEIVSSFLMVDANQSKQKQLVSEFEIE